MTDGGVGRRRATPPPSPEPVRSDLVFLRQARDEDVPAMHAVAGRYSMQVLGRATSLTEELIRSALSFPGQDRTRDFPVVTSRDENGPLLAMGRVSAIPPYSEVRMSMYVDPDLAGSRSTDVLQLLTDALMGAASHHAREVVEGGSQAMVAIGLPRDDTASSSYLAGRGFVAHRQVYDMLLHQVGRTPVSPTWPPGLQVRSLAEKADLIRAAEVINEAFLDHQGDLTFTTAQLLHQMCRPSARPDLSLVVSDVDGPLAASFSYDDPDSGYVDGLGVLRRARGQGIGLAMLHETFRGFARSGQPRVRLFVEADNRTGAVRLYERAGMRAESVLDIWRHPLNGPDRR